MIALLERLVPLWTQPVDARDAPPEAAFREVYADPVAVNGVETTVTDLVGRARSLQRAFDQLDMHILDAVEAPDRVVIAFLMRKPIRIWAHLLMSANRQTEPNSGK